MTVTEFSNRFLHEIPAKQHKVRLWVPQWKRSLARTFAAVVGRTWFATAPAENERASPCMIATLDKFILAAEGMGFTCDDLLKMLNGGMTLAEVLDLMILRATSFPKAC